MMVQNTREKMVFEKKQTLRPKPTWKYFQQECQSYQHNIISQQVMHNRETDCDQR